MTSKPAPFRRPLMVNWLSVVELESMRVEEIMGSGKPFNWLLGDRSRE
jgi:hypothetical protein